MVNKGPSAGCRTCKTRRVKCDEGKPSCQQCIRLGYRCGGYEIATAKIRFKDQTSKFCPKRYKGHKPALLACPSGRKSSILCSLSPGEEDLAMSFFLTSLVTTGRDFRSSRGLFELIGPALSIERHDSALSLAISSIAIWTMSMFRRQKNNKQTIKRYQGLAIERVRKAIENPAESKSYTTVLAALILQLHENLTAVHEQYKASSTHHDGAVALITQDGLNGISTQHKRYLLSHILHTEVSSAIQGQRRVRMCSGYWNIVPENASTKLDLIGVSIANLRHLATQMFSQEPDNKSEVPLRQQILDMGENIYSDLMAWSRYFPPEWHPLKALPETIARGSIPTYMGRCDIYPSVQVASIWNLWRCYCLMVLKVMISCIEFRPQNLATEQIATVFTRNRKDEIYQEIQGLLDSICSSVPYHLGNRQIMASIGDLIDPSLSFPSYYDFNRGDSNLTEHVRNGDFMSLQEHTNHVIVQGPWHILSTLTHVLNLFSEGFGNRSGEERSGLSCVIRPGQLNWIRGQVVRLARLQNLGTAHTGNGASDIATDTSKFNFSTQGCFPRPDASTQGSVDRLVNRIREGLRWSGGS